MFTNLIVLFCHAALRSFGFTDPLDELYWFLQSFQKGEVRFYIEHMKRAVEEAAKSPDAILVISGGQTRKEAGPISEALSYWLVCEFYGWWGHPEVRERTLLEEHARDSYQNLLFSIARFREYSESDPQFATAYPMHIAVVSWEFKRERIDLHREFIRFPREHFTYIGANNPPQEKLADTLASEAKTVEAFKLDPYGNGGALKGKRKARTPFKNGIPYPLTAPEIRNLLLYEGTVLFTDKVPWL